MGRTARRSPCWRDRRLLVQDRLYRFPDDPEQLRPACRSSLSASTRLNGSRGLASPRQASPSSCPNDGPHNETLRLRTRRAQIRRLARPQRQQDHPRRRHDPAPALDISNRATPPAPTTTTPWVAGTRRETAHRPTRRFDRPGQPRRQLPVFRDRQRRERGGDAQELRTRGTGGMPWNRRVPSLRPAPSQSSGDRVTGA